MHFKFLSYRTMKTYHLLTVLTILITISCDPPQRKQALDELTSYMSGYFENSEQAAVDTTHTHRYMQLCQIWEDDRQRNWLYTEEGMVESQGRSFRQRIYEIKSESETSFTLDAYVFPHPFYYNGKCATPEYFVAAVRDSLVLRERCTIRLNKIGEGEYKSSIIDRKGCTTRRKDIAYLTADMAIRQDEFDIWIRGYDYDDQQVFGEVETGYHYRRVNN